MRRGGDVVDSLSIFRQTGDQRADSDTLGAGIDHDACQNTLIHRLDLHRGLVGLDLGDHIAAANPITDGDHPFRQGSGFHGWRQGWHQNINRHLYAPRKPAQVAATVDVISSIWGKASFSRLAA